MRLASNATADQSASDFKTRDQAKSAGAITLNYGNFCQRIIDFLIVAFCVYMFIRLLFVIWRREEENSTDWPCPRCREAVKEGADKCPHCAEDPIYPQKRISLMVGEEGGEEEDSRLLRTSKV